LPEGTGLRIRIIRITIVSVIVCLCHRISDRDIARSVEHGCASYDELQDELRIATSCGSCADCARNTFEAHRARACEGLARHPLPWAAVAAP
jgi:bacterioferritin-associated ferredoxin